MSAPNPDSLSGVRSKIGRTKKHIHDLEGAHRAFFDTNPYRIGVVRDPDTRRPVYFVDHVEDVPTDITQIAGDAIGNMVAILDHLAYRLFLKSGGTGPGRHVYFPIAKNAANASDYVDERKRKVQGMAPQIISALDALEPYKGGKGHQLWVLNELNNLSKHRDLIAVGSSLRGVDVGSQLLEMVDEEFRKAMPNLTVFLKPENRLCPLKVRDRLFIDTPDAKPNEKMKFSFDVSLNEPGIIEAEPLLPAIHNFFGLVDGIVQQFIPHL